MGPGTGRRADHCGGRLRAAPRSIMNPDAESRQPTGDADPCGPDRSAPAAPPARFARAWRLLAATSLSLGGAGVVLPLLPTTPFVLLALWASARGSPELNARIRRHPRYRELIHAWENGRGIPRRAKYAALALLAISWLGLWLGGGSQALLSGAGIAFVLLGAIIVTRPEPGYCDE